MFSITRTALSMLVASAAMASFLVPAYGQDDAARLAGLDALKQKDYPNAQLLFQKNLDSLKSAGITDIRFGAAFVDLSGVYNAQGDYANAEDSLRRAIAVFEKSEPDRGPMTMMASNLLEQIYEKDGKLHEAETQLTDLKEFYEQNYAGEPSLAAILKRYAALLVKIGGRDAEVKAALTKADSIEAARKPDGNQAEQLAAGAAAVQKNDLAGAATSYKAALAAAEIQYGKNDVRYADALFKLATVYMTQKRYLEAEPMARQVITIREKNLGPMHENVADGLRLLAGILQQEGKVEESMDSLDRANKIIVVKLKAVDPMLAEKLQGVNDKLAELREIMHASDENTAKPISKDEAIRQNMRIVQVIVEAYSLEHKGKYPQAVGQALSPYFSGSGRWGHAPINPFSTKAEWPMTGRIASFKAARLDRNFRLQPGKIEYSVLNGGANYAIRGGGTNGKVLLDKDGKNVLVLTNMIEPQK